MEATAENVALLRLKLGESVPEGGDASDTLFTDAQIISILETAPFMDRAALEGWQIKAAQFANLVNVTDGAAVREFSDLLANARSMVGYYDRAQSGPTAGRTRIGRIVRE